MFQKFYLKRDGKALRSSISMKRSVVCRLTIRLGHNSLHALSREAPSSSRDGSDCVSCRRRFVENVLIACVISVQQDHFDRKFRSSRCICIIFRRDISRWECFRVVPFLLPEFWNVINCLLYSWWLKKQK